MDLVLKYRNEIYGFLALWIIFFHIERQISLPTIIPILSPFLQRGNSAVDIFFFLSGFCLCLSLKKDFNLKRFYTRRFKRIVFSYLIIAIPFFLWKSIVVIPSMGLLGFLLNVTGISFWTSGCLDVWFVHAILFFYAITPILFLIVSKGKSITIFTLFFYYVLIFLFHHYLPFYKSNGIALTRLPIYFIGIITAYYIPQISFVRNKIGVPLFILFGILLLTTLPSYYSGFVCWVLYAIIVIPMLLVLSSFFHQMPNSFNYVFSSLGKVSLEIYICHSLLLYMFKFYNLYLNDCYWMYLFLPAISIPLSFLSNHLSNKINNSISLVTG